MKHLTCAASMLLAFGVISGCGHSSPTQPKYVAPTAAARTTGAGAASGRTAPGQPGYEPAYVNGTTVTINAIEVPNVAPRNAQADFYEVVYPSGWQQLGIGPPQCNPCDHDGNGIDAQDFHDHVLDSMPSSPGHGNYKPLWHVFAVVPAYNGNAQHDDAVSAAYASHLPLTSEAAIDGMLGLHMPDGSPLAVEIDTQFYFICAVVGGPHL